MGEINSHIQMPKSMLKRFEGLNHQFYYYDVKQNHIGTNGHAKSHNTEPGFFSVEVDQFISVHFEEPFSSLFKIIDGISIDPPQGSINSEFDYCAKRFVYALIARNPDCISRSQTYSELSSLSAQQLRDLGVVAGLAAETDRDFLSDYGTTIAVNLTEVPLVLPTCGIYIQNFYTFDHIILPVSPQKAIVFIEERGKNTIIHDGIVQLYAINNEHTIQSFNKNAFSTQCRYKNGFIISSEKTALMDCLE